MIDPIGETLVSPDQVVRSVTSKRNPRIAVTVSPEVLDCIFALAERRKWSISKTSEYLLERGLEAERSPVVGSQLQTSDLDKLQKLLRAVRDLDL